jgi:carboxyl-terminal processing protease
MKKKLGLISGILIIVLIFCSSCNLLAKPSAELTDEYIQSLPPLYQKTEIPEVDLKILLEKIETIIATESVFTSPYFKDVFGGILKDRAHLMRAARNTMFSGFLALPKDQIPQWAIDWVEEEISSHRYDYGVFNRIYQKLVKDPRYQYLKDSSQKEKLLKVMTEGIIKSIGDPFAGYIPQEVWLLSNKENRFLGRYRGLGIYLTRNERGEIAVLSVTPGSPAERAGLKVGDAILAVDEKSTSGCSLIGFTLYVKTRKDPQMNLIVRKGLTNRLERMEVVLEDVVVQSLFTGPGVELSEGRGSSAKDLPFYYPLRDRNKKEHPEILYILIKEFTFQAAIDLYHVLTNLDMSKFKGIIIDVRGNPGGRLDAVIHCADYFLPGEELVTLTKYADGKVKEEKQNRWNLVPEDLPIVILVDKNSTSGAEMFPAALRDNGRAIIISKDERTGGKGSVNLAFPLEKGFLFWKKEYGALWVSIGLWYTPSGQMIEKMDLDQDGYYEIGGIKPDILVEWSDKDIFKNQRNPAWWDPTIFKAIEYLKERG